MHPPPSLGYIYRPISVLGAGFACGLLLILAMLLATLIGFIEADSALSLIAAADTIELVLSAGFQAICSAGLSILIGLLVAKALYRQNLVRLSSFLGSLCFLAMILPTTVAALCLLAVWGRNGLVRDTLSLFGMEGLLFPAYGLEMVVLAHIFFNAPLAVRVMLGTLYAVPLSQNRAAAQLGFKSVDYWRWIEWPALRATIPSLFGLIFLLCFSSFSLVLMLGGGPKVSTLEVAIYTSLRFSFDLPAAGILSAIQLLISSVVILSLSRFKSVHWAISLRPRYALPRSDKSLIFSRVSDGFILSGFIFLIGFPIAYLLARTEYLAGAGLLRREAFWQALHGSLTIGFLSALMSVGLVCVLTSAYHRMGKGIKADIGRYLIILSVSIYLVVPSIVLGTVSFIWLRGFVDIFSVALWLVLAANCLLALPFAWRILGAKYQAVLAATDKKCQILGLRGWQRFWQVSLPSLQHEMGLALGLTAALSIGDLGVIALFGSDDFRTLPWLLYQYAARYGGAEAELLGCILLGLCLGFYGIFYALVRLGARRRQDAYR